MSLEAKKTYRESLTGNLECDFCMRVQTWMSPRKCQILTSRLPPEYARMWSKEGTLIPITCPFNVSEENPDASCQFKAGKDIRTKLAAFLHRKHNLNYNSWGSIDANVIQAIEGLLVNLEEEILGDHRIQQREWTRHSIELERMNDKFLEEGKK